MAAFPLSLLALAAGVYLLIKTKKEFSGKLYQGLAWLIIFLSLAYMVGLGIRGWHHRMGGHGNNCCNMEQGMNHPGHGNNNCCTINGGANCGGSCGGNCDKSCGNSCGSQGHEKGACCMPAADTTATTCDGGKGSCCMDKHKEGKADGK